MGKVKKITEDKEKKPIKKSKLLKNGISAPIDDKKTIKHRKKSAESDITTLKKSKSKTSKMNLILNDFKVEKTTPEKGLKSKGLKKSLPKSPKEEQEVLQSEKPQKIKETNVFKKYKIKAADVLQAVEGVVTFVQTNPKLKNTLFNEQFPIFLQINSFKNPKGHSKLIRTVLPHSLLTPESEVCLIVAELKLVSNREHDTHKEYYEELLSKHNVTGIKQILTFHELRTEYETFELKKRLVDLYDTFLVDGRISGKVVRFCGSTFYKKRKVPTAVKLDAKNLKEHLETALQKTQMQVHLKGDSYMVQAGHSGMTKKQICENIKAIVEELDVEFPGTVSNIRGINVYANRAPPVPIYLSLKSPNTIEVPVEKTKRVKPVTDELSTALDAMVSVRPTGEVLVNAHKIQKSGKEKKLKKKSPKKKKNITDGKNNLVETSKKKKRAVTSKIEKKNKKVMKTKAPKSK